MKKLFKNILLTTTAVAGIIVPSTIVVKQSNYIEATETLRLTPFVVPTGIHGEYYEDGVDGAPIDQSEIIMPTVLFYFDVEQLYDLGIISTDLTKTTNLDLWIASSIELKNNLHLTGSYRFRLAPEGQEDVQEEWIDLEGDFSNPSVPLQPFLTEDFNFVLDSNGEVIDYSITSETDYLAISFFPIIETLYELPLDQEMNLIHINIDIQDFYYTTTNDSTHNQIVIEDLLRADEPTSDADNFIISSDDYENIGLSETQHITYDAMSTEIFDSINNTYETGFNISVGGSSWPYFSLTEEDFNNDASNGTPWYVWLGVGIGTIAVVGLAWWGIHALRNRRSNKKEETKA